MEVWDVLPGLHPQGPGHIPCNRIKLRQLGDARVHHQTHRSLRRAGGLVPTGRLAAPFDPGGSRGLLMVGPALLSGP